MSGVINQMQGVPVKIVEKYKPLPCLYQLSPITSNKLLLPSNIFNESSFFTYDFQTERRVLIKAQEWRRLRQREKDLKQERMEKRNQRKAEEREKQILGAVSYPEDLSSGSEDDVSNISPSFIGNSSLVGACDNLNSFHNILQPTVLRCLNTNQFETPHDVKLGNTINYKDFEADTSSPFDNIELKSINDLDILAQVLHNTQFATNSQPSLNEQEIILTNPCDSDIPTKYNNVQPYYKEKSNQTYSSFLDDSSITKNSSSEEKHTLSDNDPKSLLKTDIDRRSKSVPALARNLSGIELKRSGKSSYNLQNNIATLDNGTNYCGTYFSQLNDSNKQLAERISTIGFPLERVARTILLIGVDDSKIIQHLILFSELSGSGYEETKIVEALLRHGNNKAKALKDLIT
uniref:UMA domain-containing protein n=1 Tax=Glossina brevipalpis TaxID=37001 RepID=A0A1A9X2N4_9MUSC